MRLLAGEQHGVERVGDVLVAPGEPVTDLEQPRERFGLREVVEHVSPKQPFVPTSDEVRVDGGDAAGVVQVADGDAFDECFELAGDQLDVAVERERHLCAAVEHDGLALQR